MIYFDNAATTKPFKDVIKAHENVSLNEFFNPSGGCAASFELQKKIDRARKSLLKLLNADTENDNIIFTSGATEANNIAIFSSATNKKATYLFSNGEHPSVHNCAKELFDRGYDVKFIPLQQNGQLDYDAFSRMMNENVVFVSTIFVNNETGAVNDLLKIRNIINSKNKQAIFHVDAVQGFGKVALNLGDLGVNLCAISSHKVGGLKGTGALYVSKNTKIKSLSFGGGQEFGLRSGTVNAAGILSFLKAAEIVFKNFQANFEKVNKLRDKLISRLKERDFSGVKIVSDEKGSPYIISLIFKNCRGEVLQRCLDSKGICVGRGSACSTNLAGNRVLEAMNYSKNEVMGALRVSFGFDNLEQEIDAFLLELKQCLKILNG